MPSQQFGIGLNIDGVTGQYAFSPSLSAGVTLGFWTTTGEAGVSSYTFGPYARYMLQGVVNPFLQATLLFAGGSDAQTTTSSIEVKFGLAYFFNQNVGAYAATPILELGLSPSGTAFGVGNRIIGGGEWYFNR